MAQYKLVWKSGFVTGFLRVPWICVVSFVLTFLNPGTLGQDIPEFSSVGFLLEPNDVIAVLGSSVTLNCSVLTGDTVPVVSWTQGTSPVQDDLTRTIMPSGALRIASVSAFDEGSYRCNAELENADYFSKVGTLSIARLQLQEGPEDILAYTGDTIFFTCDFDSIPSPQIRWLKNGLVLDLTEERVSARYTLFPSGGLEIREVRSTDGGTYRCQGTNRFFPSPVFSNNAFLTINPGANPDFQFIKIPNQEIQAPVGETIVIEVATDSPATFTWFKDDEEIFIVGTDEHYSLVGQGSLRIKQVGEIDTGLYRVLATSQSDDTSINHIVKVTALVPLKFNIKPSNTYINVGDDVTLDCNVYGIPGPTIEWYKDGEALETGEFYNVSPTGSLTIQDVITQDTGIYQCVADNTLENLQALAQLIVLREGIAIPTRLPETSAAKTAAPVPQITTTSPPDRPDLGPVPSEPRFVTASDVQARSFTLTWVEPSQLNGDLDNYRIYLKWNGGSKVETAYDLRKFLSDLTPETRYEVTIFAINENGDGVSSETLIVQTLPPGDYLGPPVNVQARAGESSCTALLLTWEPPQDGETQNYVVYYADLSGGVAQELELYTEQEFYLITDLKPYTRYGLRVVASNENGPGASSVNLEARTSQCKPSGFPANITLEADSASSIRVLWNQPVFIERNGLITGYKLKYRTVNNGKRTHSVVINGDARSFTIQDLDRETGYEVRMAASNANGTGPYSDWVQIATFKEDKNGSVPSMPIGLRVVVTSPYSAVASWVDQDYIGQAIPAGRNYTVRYRTNYPSNKYMYINSSDLSIVIDNLNPYTEYQFEVKASDGGVGGGHSSYGLVTTNKTFEAAPGSPPRSLTVVHVENSSTALGLNWQPPKNPNGQVTGYTIFYSTTNSDDKSDWITDYITGEELTKTIHQLTSDTMYYFKIQAHTSKGEGPISDVVAASTPTAIIVPPIPPNPVPSSGPPLAAAGAMGFPWWLWLLIILAILFIIILAVLLLLCFMCGCCACCARCCPFCDDICGCCAPICGPLAACFAGCCPCCCEDEDDCAKCWLKFCCGASACVCCGQAYRERKKAKGSANLTGYHAVSQNGKAVGSTPAPPDLWINHEGVEMKVDGKKTGMTLSPINAKSSEREMLNQGKGVDQQREGTQETSFSQSAVQNQQESQIHVSSEDQLQSSQRQSQYETPTLISAASHRSSLDSDLHVRGMGNGTVHYATVDEMHTAKKKSNVRQSGRHEAAGRTSPRYATWGAKANLNDQQKSSVNYNTTNIHVEDVRNNYTANDSFSTLRGNGHQGSSGEAFNTLDRQASHNNAYSADNQIITFPETAGGPQPFTITFEETTTSHNVEKSVPLPDGTNFKTSSSHQTFAKSYSTSDASQDQNLQAMLQGGLENGPLAIEIPSSTNNTLPAITAAPMFRSGSFNPIPQDSPSSVASHPIGRSPPMPNYNFTSSENNSAQTQSSGYTSAGNLSGNTRGRASSIGASSIDSSGYRGRRGSESYNSEFKSGLQGTSPINIPPPNPTNVFSSSFQNYDSYRMEESDRGYGLGRSASDLYNGSSGIGLTKPRAGFNTIDRSTGFGSDSAYGSPTRGTGFTLPSRTGGLSVPEYRPSNSYQSSAFQNTSESQSFGSYGNGLRSDGQSQFSYNNNNASVPTKPVEVDHAEVQTPEKFSSKSDLLQSTSYTSTNIPEFTARPLRRSMSVDHEFGLENNDSFWNSGSNTNLLSSYHRETKESRESTRGFDSGAAESQRGRSRIVGDKTYGGVSSRSRSLDRFGEREERHMSPVGGYDYHASSPRQHQMDRPAYMYNTNTTSSGYHSDTNTTSSHDDGSSTQGSTSRAGNPLSSFSVPGPPPNYQAARVKIQAPSYSPLKRNTQPGVARVRAQPLPVVTPRAPDVTYRGVGDGTSPGSTNRSFSTEDLNTEMLNLEGLMKDLNAITASELQS